VTVVVVVFVYAVAEIVTVFGVIGGGVGA